MSFELKDDAILQDILGESMTENPNGCNLTSNNVYTNLSKSDVYHEEFGIGKNKIKLGQYKENIYQVYIEIPERKSFYQYGYLFFKDGKPYIFADIPGDNRGAKIFNGTFIVSGHDGSYLFNINNPNEHLSDLK